MPLAMSASGVRRPTSTKNHATPVARATALVALLASALPLSAHATNGYFAHGYGAQALGAAGVAVSLPQDALVSHAKQPIPSDQTFFNMLAPGVVQDHVTLGFTWKTSAQGEWTGYAAHAFSTTVSGQNSIPANLLGGGEANIRVKQNILGVAYGWKF